VDELILQLINQFVQQTLSLFIYSKKKLLVPQNNNYFLACQIKIIEGLCIANKTEHIMNKLY